MTRRIEGYIRIPFVYESEDSEADDLWEILAQYLCEKAEEACEYEGNLMVYTVIEKDEMESE